MSVRISIALALALLLSCGAALAQQPPPPQLSANVAVFAGGLNNPRGLKFGPDGALYVAEGGAGGATSTAGVCEQVPPPVGPYTGGKTARISKIDSNGGRTTVVETLPSSQASQNVGGVVLGVADVAFVGDTLYGLLAGGGCSHGVPDEPNGVLKVNPDGTSALIADLSAFVHGHPTAHPNPGDFEPDETSYSMIASGGKLYVVEPNHGALDEVTPGASIRRVLDISASQGHVVPASIAVGPDGNFYVGNLTTLPYKDGSANIYKITSDGQIGVAVHGLTTVLGVAFDGQGQMYVLETSTHNIDQPPFQAPGTGKVVRVTSAGGLEDVATGLSFPTAMTFGPDGKLYVSNYGFGFPPGAGQVVRVDVSAPLSAPPTAPAKLPRTGGADFAWLAWLLAAIVCLALGLVLRRRQPGRS
jgi:LPXTG-motif cell wall-anchored protein